MVLGDTLLSVTDAAACLDISRQRVVSLCNEGRIVGARKIGHVWIIPAPVQRIPGRNGRPPKARDD